MKKILFFTVIFVLALFVANAQELMQVFKVDADGPLSWFIGDNTTRGMCANPATGSILVVSRTSGDNIYKLDSVTGASLGTLNTTGISGGWFTVNKIDVTSDGVIYVCNLGGISSSDFKIYRYANESAAPTAAYTELAAVNRLGDEIAVTGTGTGTKILVTAFQRTALAKFTTTDGNTFTKNEVTPGNPDFAFGDAGPGYTNLAWDPNGTDYFACKPKADDADGRIFKYSGSTDQSTGSPIVTRAMADCPGGSGPFTVKQLMAETIIAFGPALTMGATPTGVYCTFYDGTGAALGYRTGGLEKTGAMAANANGSGDVSINDSTRKVYVLLTNNSISGWSLPGSTVQDWNLY